MADMITLKLRTEDGEMEVLVDRNAELLDVGEQGVCLSGGCSPPLGKQLRKRGVVELPGTIGQLQALKRLDVSRRVFEKKIY